MQIFLQEQIWQTIRDTTEAWHLDQWRPNGDTLLSLMMKLLFLALVLSVALPMLWLGLGVTVFSSDLLGPAIQARLDDSEMDDDPVVFETFALRMPIFGIEVRPSFGLGVLIVLSTLGFLLSVTLILSGQLERFLRPS